MLLCTQDRRTGVARRCSLLLYIGLDHTEPSASSGAAPHRHAASVLWAPVHRGRLPRRSSGSSGQWSASCSRRAGGWRSGSMGPVYVPTTVRYRDLVNAIERICNALTRKPRYSAFCRIATRPPRVCMARLLTRLHALPRVRMASCVKCRTLLLRTVGGPWGGPDVVTHFLQDHLPAAALLVVPASISVPAS